MDLQRTDLDQVINTEVANLKEMAKLILESTKDSAAVEDQLNTIRHILKSYEKSANELDNQKSLYDRVKERITRDPDEDNFNKIMKSETQPVQESSYGFVSSFDAYVNELISEKNTDESIVMTGEAQTAEILDPWTKHAIQTPIECVDCRHKYEKKSVESLLKRKSHFKCPYIGCDSFVTSSNIQEC